MGVTREDQMFYRGPGFLAIFMIRFHAHSLPPLPSASYLSFSVFLSVAGQAGGRGEEGVGVEANYSILSGRDGAVWTVDPFTVIPAIPIGEEFSHWSKRKIRTEILEAENWKLKRVRHIPMLRIPIFYGSGSGSDFWQVPAPDPTFDKLRF
jgi:hypothetical protein